MGLGLQRRVWEAGQTDLHRPFSRCDRRSFKRFFRLPSGRLYESLSTLRPLEFLCFPIWDIFSAQAAVASVRVVVEEFTIFKTVLEISFQEWFHTD